MEETWEKILSTVVEISYCGLGDPSSLERPESSVEEIRVKGKMGEYGPVEDPPRSIRFGTK